MTWGINGFRIVTTRQAGRVRQINDYKVVAK